MYNKPLEQLIANVSVVIPTLGGGTIVRTIECLNQGEYIPTEILICIPRDFAHRVNHISCNNLKIIQTETGGQVNQRAIGFQAAVCSFVLQLDDDLELDRSCLKNLVEFMSNKSNVSVSPTLLDIVTRKPSSHMEEPNSSSGILYRFLFTIINGAEGYQPGKISKAGVNMAYSINHKEPYEVEWLPGGCALHSRENLIKYNYYPFSGKAYSEDLFHSVILRRNGVKLYHCPQAICSLDNTSSKGDGILSLINIFLAFSKVMFKFAKFNNNNRVRLVGFFLLNYLILITNKIFKNHNVNRRP